MIELLSRIFIPNYKDVKVPGVRKAYGILMSVVGISVNLLLATFKLLAGTLSGSISVTADALNNFSDAASQIISFISFKLSAKPADRAHPFGHARIEYVASMIVSFLILLVGVELLGGSFSKILRPVTPTFRLLAVFILGFSALAKLWLALASRRVAKKIDSAVVRATSADSFSDVLATLAVLISALLCRFFNWNIDGYIGLAVAVMILISGFRILNETKNAILGTPPSRELVEAVHAMAREYPDILGIHDMVVHSYGPGNTIASLHAEVDGAKDVFYIHDIIDRLERRLWQELGMQATIHMDPAVTDDERVTALRVLAERSAREVDERLGIHDCRYVPSEENPKLIFDMTVPFELKRSDTELCSAVRARLAEHEPRLLLEITVDRR